MTPTTQTECNGETGHVVPVIDRSRCEAKNECVTVCPYNVFEIRKLTAAERAPLPLRAKVKLFFHGGRQAFTPRAADCHACGLCVEACPEGAIALRAQNL